jgi:hypothetical protein
MTVSLQELKGEACQCLCSAVKYFSCVASEQGDRAIASPLQNMNPGGTTSEFKNSAATRTVQQERKAIFSSYYVMICCYFADAEERNT